jgi:hypothetical protein
MGNNLKFNSSVCTTREQSQRLLDLGLKPETADMAHQYIEAEWGWFISPCDWNLCTMSEELIPAWSLHRLMEILDAPLVEFSISTLEEAYEDVIYNISESITIGKGNPEWGAPTEDVFIIKLGKRV